MAGASRTPSSGCQPNGEADNDGPTADCARERLVGSSPLALTNYLITNLLHLIYDAIYR